MGRVAAKSGNLKNTIYSYFYKFWDALNSLQNKVISPQLTFSIEQKGWRDQLTSQLPLISTTKSPGSVKDGSGSKAAWNTQTAVTIHIPLNRSLVKTEMKTQVSHHSSPRPPTCTSTKEPMLTQLFVHSPCKSRRTRNCGSFQHDHQPNTPPQ